MLPNLALIHWSSSDNWKAIACTLSDLMWMQAGRGAAKIIMMTMVPLDNHICFVAISLHAKVLYGNESIAALLGYKSANDISGKLTLPQLMTIPCQQLHQNFFKVRKNC